MSAPAPGPGRRGCARTRRAARARPVPRATRRAGRRRRAAAPPGRVDSGRTIRPPCSSGRNRLNRAIQDGQRLQVGRRGLGEVPLDAEGAEQRGRGAEVEGQRAVRGVRGRRGDVRADVLGGDQLGRPALDLLTGHARRSCRRSTRAAPVRARRGRSARRPRRTTPRRRRGERRAAGRAGRRTRGSARAPPGRRRALPTRPRAGRGCGPTSRSRSACSDSTACTRSKRWSTTSGRVRSRTCWLRCSSGSRPPPLLRIQSGCAR